MTTKTKFPEVGIRAGNMILAAPRERSEKQYTSHHASSLLNCSRQLFYRLSGAPITNPMTEWRAMQLQASRDAQEAATLKLAMKPGVTIIDVERYISLEHAWLASEIRGYIDILWDLETEDGLARYLTEYKAPWGSGVIECIAGTLQEPPHPKPRDLAQIQFYLRVIEPDHAQLVYEDRVTKAREATYEVIEIENQVYWASVPKNGGNPLWEAVEWTWDDILEKLVMIEKAVDDGEPPDRSDPVTGEVYSAILNKEETKVSKQRCVERAIGDECPACKHVYEKAQAKCKSCGHFESVKTHWMCWGCDYMDHCWLGKEEA